ncbi:MAG: hypothetical protein AAF519_10240 [Bacteroidota bacterium]
MKTRLFLIFLVFLTLGLPNDLILTTSDQGSSVNYKGLKAQGGNDDFVCPEGTYCPDVGDGGGVRCPVYGDCGSCFKWKQVPASLFGEYRCGCYYTGYQSDYCSECQTVPC